MKRYTVVEYERSDFDAVKNGMTKEEAIYILDALTRGYFPYRLPEWGTPAKTSYYDN